MKRVVKFLGVFIGEGIEVLLERKAADQRDADGLF